MQMKVPLDVSNVTLKVKYFTMHVVTVSINSFNASDAKHSSEGESVVVIEMLCIFFLW